MAERYSPTGHPIVGTIETITGTSGVLFTDDGSYNYDGTGTEVDWNSQKTKMLAGETIFVDGNGDEWFESQLIEDPEQAVEPEDVVDPWSDQLKVQHLVEEKLAELLAIVAPLRRGEKYQRRNMINTILEGGVANTTVALVLMREELQAYRKQVRK